MYNNDGKLYFEVIDFEIAVGDISSLIKKETKKIHLVTLYRGGLPLGVRLSNQLNIPLTILDYQRLDGVSKEVKMIKNAGISPAECLYVVDDIADVGISLSKTIAFLLEHYPKNELKVYTIYGNDEKHNPVWKYTFKHEGEWVQFIPWEGT